MQLNPRLAQCRKRMREAGLDALVVSTPHNRFHLSGFSGSAGMVYVDSAEAVLITDFRYAEQARGEVHGLQVTEYRNGVHEELARLFRSLRPKRVGFETKDSHAHYLKLRDACEGVELVGADTMLASLRLIKRMDEIEAVRAAAAIGDRGFAFLLETIQPGLREREVALELECFMKRQGASGVSFETIVASGPRSSLPHGTASDRIIQTGDLVVLDFGCIVDHYCSDMTRTIAVGGITPEQQAVYHVVLEAQQMALAAARPGVSVRDLDAVARDHIAKSGYAEAFGHGLGHGVGLEVHEAPHVSSRGTEVLQENMLITIEPGIYLDGRFGVRIEDLVRITANGCERLNQASKSLQIL